ncbi:MAG: DUF86 domain-containing protein [Myxococcota bacterium]|nr:DUF86 domain-containing protein [Myxococcota bacterium]
MDRKLIDEKLESLRRCVERIRSRCPEQASQLASDPDLQDIVALNLTRAVQICVDIAAVVISSSPLPAPDTMGAAFDALAELEVIDEGLARQMKAAVGFRNIAVHSYQQIDWAIVHRLCGENVNDFRRFASEISRVGDES